MAQIERGVPVMTQARIYRPEPYPVKFLQVGESFSVWGAKAWQLLGKAKFIAAKYDREFVALDGPKGARIWRVR